MSPNLGVIRAFNVRTSGRDLTAVRRPDRTRLAAKAVQVQSVAIDPASLKKAELVELAGSRGKATTGTKADIAARLAESNDATVETTDG